MNPSLNDTYSGIPDVVHDELDFVLVPLRPRRGDVHQPGEQLHAVSDHVEVQLPLGEDRRALARIVLEHVSSRKFLLCQQIEFTQ